MLSKEMLEKRLAELQDAQKSLAERMRTYQDALAKTKADFEATGGAIQQTQAFLAMLDQPVPETNVQQNADQK
jgi:hypothetical protein